MCRILGEKFREYQLRDLQEFDADKQRQTYSIQDAGTSADPAAVGTKGSGGLVFGDAWRGDVMFGWSGEDHVPLLDWKQQASP